MAKRNPFSKMSRVRRRKIFMPKKPAFGTVDIHGRKVHHGISKKEEIWLNKLGIQERSKIVYGFKGKILILDGYDPKTNTALEYLGDTYHGSHMLYPKNRDVPLWIGKTPNQLYFETIERFMFLHNLGMKIYFIWESNEKRGLPGRYYKGPGDNLY